MCFKQRVCAKLVLRTICQCFDGFRSYIDRSSMLPSVSRMDEELHTYSVALVHTLGDLPTSRITQAEAWYGKYLLHASHNPHSAS